MYQKVQCTCRVVVLVIKPIAFLRFSLRPSPLLKLQNICTEVSPFLGVVGLHKNHFSEE